MPDKESEQEIPVGSISIGSVVRWSSVALSIVMALISATWQVASIKNDHADLVRTVDFNEKSYQSDKANLNQFLADRIKLNDAFKADTNARLATQDKQLNDLNNQLTVAITLLHRIDEKLNKP
jgi:hypothetical protein